MRWIRYLIAILAIGRVAYSVPGLMVLLAAITGGEPLINPGPEAVSAAVGTSWAQFGYRALYLAAYAITAGLVLVRPRHAIWPAILAALLDLGYWVSLPFAATSISVDADQYTSHDTLLNVVALVILAGTVFLASVDDRSA
jgi:hypothetical protein